MEKEEIIEKQERERNEVILKKSLRELGLEIFGKPHGYVHFVKLTFHTWRLFTVHVHTW